MSFTAQFNPFDEQTESWTLYAERLEQYFIANDIGDEAKRKATLLTVIGPGTYATLRNIVGPAKPTDKGYDTLIKALTDYFNPVPSEIVERYKFNSRDRKPGETIAKYISELRRMSEFCNYGTTLDNMLRDRLVCGCKEDSLQKRLLAEEKLTLVKAMSIAQAMEQAVQNVSTMRNQQIDESADKVHAISLLSKRRHPTRRGKQASATKHVEHPNLRESNFPKEEAGNKCYRCGAYGSYGHLATKCPYLNSTCHTCGRKGHISKACLSKQRKREDKIKHIDVEKTHSQEYDVFCIPNTSTQLARQSEDVYHIPAQKNNERSSDPYRIQCKINKKQITMEIDTGSAFSLISSTEAEGIIDSRNITTSEIRLKSFSGHSIEVIGTSQAKVTYRSHEDILPIVIYKGSGPTLCGRSWMSSSLPIIENGMVPQVNAISKIADPTKTLQSVLSEHEEIFDLKKNGHLRGVKVQLYRKPNVEPKFFKARSVPYAYKEKVDMELRRLEETGIISPVPFAQSAAPIVPVLKPSGNVRICGDFKVTANRQIETEKYPLPKAEDIFAKLSGCKIFTRLDMRDAYSQLELEETSKELVVINTQKGLFQYNFLPYGISSASAIFQKHMETLLRNEDSVTPFQDDILLGGTDEIDHLKRLDSLLRVMKEAGLKLRREKCQFARTSIDFLGHHLDSQGLHPLSTKTTAISDAPEPRNIEELRSFLGLINYYAKFIPNYATELSPLFRLLEKSTGWRWDTLERNTFKKAKEFLLTSNFLIHFDPTKEIRLACDASPVGIGAVLSHFIDNEERPISFASRTISTAEKNYSQLEKEALSLVYGVTKFRDYLLGRRFKLITDHQPLVSLLSESKPIPQMSAARLQRWSLVLSAYNYQIEYKKGAQHSNADALSRLPLPVEQNEAPLPTEYVLLMEKIDRNPTTVADISLATENDDLLTRIKSSVINGWKREDRESNEAKPYYTRREELSTMQGVLMIGQRVIIPKVLRLNMLEQLHETHQGIVRMKSLARSMYWWPKIDEDITEYAKQCETCQSLAPEPKKTFSPWPDAKTPWSRVHCDFAGPIENKFLLITVDAFTKWIEVDVVATTSTECVIRSLRSKMARFGIIRTLVTDNASCFTSHQFKEFTEKNGIKHVTIAPYHPQSNGQAERTVRTVKGSLKKVSGGQDATIDILRDGLTTYNIGTLEQRLARILMRYRRTPLVCGKSPAELMMGRNIITCMDLSHPKNQLEIDVNNTPNKAKFHLDEEVYTRNYSRGAKWIHGRISKKIGTTMYEVTSGNKIMRKHQNQLKKRHAPSGDKNHVVKSGEQSTLLKSRCPRNIPDNEDHWFPTPLPTTTIIPHDNERIGEEIPTNTTSGQATINEAVDDKTGPNQECPRRSQRLRKPTDRLGL